MMDPAGILALERAGLRAVPAAEEADRGGWRLRAHGGPWRRANAIHPLGPPGSDPEAAIEEARAWYAARGLPPQAKLTPAAAPADLDARLAARGWRREAPTTVMTRSVAGDGEAPRGPAGLSVDLLPSPDDAWLGMLLAWEPRHAAAPDRFRDLVVRAGPEPRFGVAREAGRPVAAGMAVRDGPLLGLFDLVTDPRARGRGVGTVVLERLCAWGAAAGASTAWLQVEEVNPRARSLYERRGFREAYPYWYRVSSP